MKKYYDTIFKHCIEEGKNPIYFVRYEDLVTSKKENDKNQNLNKNKDRLNQM